MRALVVGGSGFVGAHLIAHLQARGWPTAATKLPQERAGAAAIPWHDADLLAPEALAGVLARENPDCIFHLAAQSSVALSWKNPALTVDINVKGTVNLLEAVRALPGRPRVLLIGSSEEYGPVRPENLPVTEDAPLRPGNVYAATKAAQGMLGGVYAKAYGLDIVMVRAFNHFGPGQSSTFVVSDFCRQVAEAEAGLRAPALRAGNLDARRDFTDVRDVVRAYALLAEKGKTGEVYNVGSGRAVSVRQMLDTILRLAKVPVTVENDPDRMRPSDVPVVETDAGRLRGATGWVPEIPLEETLADTLNWWRARTATQHGTAGEA